MLSMKLGHYLLSFTAQREAGVDIDDVEVDILDATCPFSVTMNSTFSDFPPLPSTARGLGGQGTNATDSSQNMLFLG